MGHLRLWQWEHVVETSHFIENQEAKGRECQHPPDGLFLPFISSMSLATEMVLSRVRISPIQLIFSGNSLTDTHRNVPQSFR